MPKNEKNFFFSEINAYENVPINCLSKEDNTSHQQSMG